MAAFLAETPKWKFAANKPYYVRELSESKEDFIQYLNEVRSKMKERGLAEGRLQEILSKKNQEVSFEKLLEEARKEAAENGLTEEIVEQLLNED